LEQGVGDDHGEAEKQAADAFLEREVSDRAEHWVSG